MRQVAVVATFQSDTADAERVWVSDGGLGRGGAAGGDLDSDGGHLLLGADSGVIVGRSPRAGFDTLLQAIVSVAFAVCCWRRCLLLCAAGDGAHPSAASRAIAAVHAPGCQCRVMRAPCDWRDCVQPAGRVKPTAQTTGSACSRMRC